VRRPRSCSRASRLPMLTGPLSRPTMGTTPGLGSRTRR
jgi:hypothetical protein